MATIRVAIDNIQGKSADAKTLETFAEKLRAAGHTVTTHGVGPNRIQRTMRSSSNSCDIMIQVAGGKCLGTLVDFYKGLGKYYHAKAGGFAYFKCWKPEWKACRAHDDNFSRESDLAPYKGKTLPEIYKMMNGMYYGYGTTAEDCAKTWINNYGGNSNATLSASQQNQGSSRLELIKQVCSDLDPYGVDWDLKGDTMIIKRTNPNTAKKLTNADITQNSINYTDFDTNTPNSYKNVKDQQLIDRFGIIPLDESINSTWEDQVLQVNQRGHGHSIDLVCRMDPAYFEGNWVELYLPDLRINGRKYYITKSAINDERSLSVTLEPGPPSRYVEVTEEATEETTDETSTEDA